METTVNYKLEDAYQILKEKQEKYNWQLTGELPSEPTSFTSRSQEKKYLKAVRYACKKGSMRAFNKLFYRISKITKQEDIRVIPSIKERTIQAKRKTWKELQAKADEALQAYKSEKGDFYKKREL